MVLTPYSVLEIKVGRSRGFASPGACCLEDMLDSGLSYATIYKTYYLIGATNPNADTRNADIVKKISRRKGIFIRPNE